MEIILTPVVLGLFGCGVLFIVAGLLMKNFPPKKINSLYGYRTAASMKSQERWDFAQIYGATQMIYTGMLQCLLSLLFLGFHWLFPISNSLATGILIFTLVISSMLLLLKVESKIKKRFND